MTHRRSYPRNNIQFDQDSSPILTPWKHSGESVGNNSNSTHHDHTDPNHILAPSLQGTRIPPSLDDSTHSDDKYTNYGNKKINDKIPSPRKKPMDHCPMFLHRVHATVLFMYQSVCHRWVGIRFLASWTTRTQSTFVSFQKTFDRKQVKLNHTNIKKKDTHGLLCYTRNNMSHKTRIRKRNMILPQDFMILFLTTGLVILSFLFFLQYHVQNISQHIYLQNDSVPVIIPSLDYTQNNYMDMGGFLFPKTSTRRSITFFSQYQNKSMLVKSKNIENDTHNSNTTTLNGEDSFSPDYGGLILPSIQAERTIHPNDSLLYDEQRKQQERNDKSKTHARKRRWVDDDYEPARKAVSQSTVPDCRHASWHKLYYPTCNTIHEYDISRDWDLQQRMDSYFQHEADYESFYSSYGYYREVWILDHKNTILQNNEEHLSQHVTSSTFRYPLISDTNHAVALKLLRFRHNFTESSMDKVRKDALIMERLTSSPRIIDIYGLCGTTMTVEFIEHEVEEFIVPGHGYATFEEQQRHDREDVNPRNDYTPTEKLEIALAMAESLADLHGFKDGVIVHDDVQLCQWLRKAKDGRLKLGDFNRAGLMLFDEKKGKYCKYYNGQGFGNYRSPEEFAAKGLNEQIDVYSFGNNIYALLTGLWVFYANEDDAVVQSKVIKGERAFVDQRYRNHSFAESVLVEIMEKCWIEDPDKRITIFDD